jgi:cytochrome b
VLGSDATKVWDWPTRLFHWLVVLLFAFSWWSAENGEMTWHYRSGLTMLGLILFRLVWGFIGGSTARFASFVRSPMAALAYLRGRRSAPSPGHSPIGGYSVVAMLLLLAVQVGTGLFAVDIDGIESGPLSYLVDFDRGRQLAEIHETSFNVLLGLIGLHILAIAYYRLRGRRLIAPMITGRDPQIPPGAPGLVPAGLLRFAAGGTLAAACAWFIGNGLMLQG